MTPIESTNLSYDQYRQQAGSTFVATLASAAACPLRLLAVSERRLVSGFESFSLTLTGPLQPELEQGTYRLAHEQLGALDLFLVPERRDAQGMRYHVAFNRIPPEAQA